MPPGRKRIELDIQHIEALAGRGLTESEICDCIGISQATLIRRKHENEDFVNAIKRGKSKAHAVVANALYEAATSGQSWAVVWYEKTRRGLTEHAELLKRIEELERIARDSNHQKAAE